MSLPLSFPKTNGPAGISINGLPKIGLSSLIAGRVTKATRIVTNVLEIDTTLISSVKKEGAFSGDPNFYQLIEITDEILIGTHGQ